MNGGRWTPAEDAQLRARFSRVRAAELALEMGRSYWAVVSRAKVLGLQDKRRASQNGRPWTSAEDEDIRARFPNMRTRDLAKQLGRTYQATSQRARQLEVRKSPEFLASPDSGRLQRNDTRGAAFRFVKGQASWNKGTHYCPAGGIATRFKPGNRPQTWVPVGTETRDGDGYLKRKVRDDAPKGQSRRNWVFVHRALWEEHHGPIPRGHAVVFRNGDITDIRIENLELVTNQELMRRNTVHNLPKPLAELVQLRGAIHRQINRRSRQNGG